MPYIDTGDKIVMIGFCPTCGNDWERKPTCGNALHIEQYQKLVKRAGQSNRDVRILAIQKLGGKCVNCGITDTRILQINHKNGGGTRDFRKNPIAVYREIVNGSRFLGDYDIRCANCNILYEYEVGRRKTHQ